MKNLLDKVEFIIVPLVNPDGYEVEYRYTLSMIGHCLIDYKMWLAASACVYIVYYHFHSSTHGLIPDCGVRIGKKILAVRVVE